jgi:TolB-like protein
MRKLWSILRLALLVSCASAPAGTNADAAADLTLEQALKRAARDITGKLPRGTKIAVAGFQSESDNLSDYLMEELDFALLDTGMTIVDRAALNALRKELHFQLSGEVDEASAQSIGKFLGAEYAVTGQFILTGDAYRLRITSVKAENAVRTAASALNVRNDADLQKLVETVNRNTIKTHSAEY